MAVGDNWTSCFYGTKAYSGVARVSFSSGFNGAIGNTTVSNIVTSSAKVKYPFRGVLNFRTSR
jgi:hypothetical protein